jgi:glyceraldehyde 3-phosphate dehydrogenase
MSVRVAINGFGRIGRQIVRSESPSSGLEIVAINDLTDPATLAYLLKYDSVHGRFPGEVSADEKNIIINGKKIPVLAQTDVSKIPWRDFGVDIVLECTGLFTDRDKAAKHLEQGVKKVIISAPAKNPDITLACGINLEKYDRTKHHVISNASCTTNCLAPVAKVLDETFKIVRGQMTTIHSYTNDQRILDLPHKDLRRARAAAVNMIPTSTGAARALGEVLPTLKGKLDGMAMRVPTPNVSVVDLVARLEKTVTRDEVNDAFRKAASGALKGILAVTDEPVVSSDFDGDPASATVDLTSTMVTGELVKVLAWYDNETGYGHRLYDLCRYVAQQGL